MTDQQKELIEALIDELEDAVSFMETLKEYEDEVGEQRRLQKEALIKLARKEFS
jgi:hypothetical protein